MRAVVFALVLAPALSSAERLPLVVYKNRVKPVEPGTAALSISRTVYVNNCLPDGCTLVPGNDDSRTNRSSIASSTTTLDAWSYGDARWAELMDCVNKTFLPFNINVVTTDPGNANHFEVMVGGKAAQLSPDLVAGGVAPFIGCGASDDNVISFVFAGQTNDVNFLCGAVAQEVSHVWGLDHELNKLDPMTYLDLGSLKRFQNTASQCGEELDSPRGCYCGGDTQNSYEYLTNLFGAADLPAPTLALTPADGAYVRPGFPIRAALDSVLGETSATFALDGAQVAMLSPGPFAFNAPSTTAPGAHVISVTALDGGGRSVTATATVTLMVACTSDDACSGDTHCLGGVCLPGASVDGGLGATCTDSGACITGQCGTADGTSLCTAACDPNETCPDGYECLAAGASGVCWPASSDGGCAAGDTSAPGWLLAGIAAIVVRLRRRR